MEDLLRQLLAKVEVIESGQKQVYELLRHGATPPEWVSAKVLAQTLGIKVRAVEFYRYDLGVIPVDGEVCRKVGKHYEYRLESCRRLIEDYKALSPEMRRVWKNARGVA